MRMTTFGRRGVALAVMVAGCGLTAPGAAQTLEEVIVTAQKRQVSLQDAPVAVSAFSGEQMQAFNFNDSRDIAAKTPNLFMAPSGGGLPLSQQVYIRGQGQNAINISLDPSIGTYIDGIYVAKDSGSLVELVDLERIEVLRGPQGTLYGRNTTGGAIKMFSVRPDPEADIGGWVRGTLGDYGRVKTQGAVNLPVSPAFALRYAGSYHQRDGYTETNYLDDMQQVVRQEETNDLDSQFHRLNALWNASDSLSVFASAYLLETEINGHLNRSLAGDTGQPPAFRFHSNDFYEGAANHLDALGEVVDPKSEVEGHGLALEAVWDTPAGFEAQATFGYRENDANAQYFDVDGTAWGFLQVHSSTPQDFKSWTAELQLKGLAMAERLSWLAGLYWFEEEGYDGTESTFFIQGRSPELLQAVRADGENGSVALFSHLTYDLSEALTVEGGLRWTRDEKELYGRNRVKPLVSPFELCLYTAGKPDVTNTTTAPGGAIVNPDVDICRFDPSEEWDYWSWTAGLQYRFSDTLMAYARSSRAQRAGGLQYRDISGEFPPFDEETLIDFEIGFKSQFADNRVRLNVAYFYGNYEDYQNTIQPSTSLGTVTTATVNFGDADVQGLEVDFEALLAADLSLQIGLGTTEVDYDGLDAQRLRGFNIPETAAFQQFNIPELTAFMALSYRPSYSFGEGLGQLSWSYRDELEKAPWTTPTTPANQAFQQNSKLDDFYVLDARAGVTLHNGLSLYAWGRNILGEEYYIDALNFNNAQVVGYVGEPRTYGVELGYSW